MISVFPKVCLIYVRFTTALMLVQHNDDHNFRHRYRILFMRDIIGLKYSLEDETTREPFYLRSAHSSHLPSPYMSDNQQSINKKCDRLTESTSRSK